MKIAAKLLMKVEPEVFVDTNVKFWCLGSCEEVLVVITVQAAS